MKEHILVFFTLLAQAAIGAFIIFYILHPWVGQIVGQPTTHFLTQRFLLAIGVLFGLALLASLFHLGNPLNAWRALTNLRSSWLSREILFALLFMGLWASVAILEWSQDSSPFIRNALTLLAAINGLAMIFCMSRVYMLRTVQAWNSISTPLSFFISSFVLGAILVGLGLYINFQSSLRLREIGLGIEHDLLADLLRWISLGGFCLLGVDFLVSSLKINRLRNAQLQSGRPTRFSVRLFTIRQSLLLAALTCVSLLAINPIWALSVSPTITIAIGLAVFLFLFAAEILERTLFYITGLQHTL
jgi:anaerobic dimethyl sulfoxide reductase subunit C (anchor subunit)